MVENLPYVLPMSDNKKKESLKVNCLFIALKVIIIFNFSLGLLFLILGNSYYISFPIIFELLGYCGILNSNVCLFISYICYQILYMLSKLSIIYYYYMEYNSNNIELFYIVVGLIVITIIFNFCSIILTCKITNNLKILYLKT